MLDTKRGRLKPWHEMMNKKTKVISQPTHLSKTIGQSCNTTNVQNSSSSQPQDVGSFYWPQLIYYGYNLLTRDINSYSPRYPQSQPLSFQASHSPQSSQGISLNLAGHNPMETEFRNEISFDLSIYSRPPPQN
ncbi:uncharacterized protein LOC114275660 [Camellia sinensis]|uniref:uncharacterized protein LOC114275660 n=1 Tax=Camellia sinensis TaxID=4442 RepID=UPI001036D5E5|nr:uncharacterized protein LOC114275660 [Camellia sinensis]